MMSIADYFSSMEYGPALEDDSHARAWLAMHGASLGHFINGQFTQPREAQWSESREPATGALLAAVAMGSAADVDAAVRAARDALPAWQALGCHGRARVMYALSRMLQRHARLFAVLEALDNGKPLRETRDIDIPLAARHFLHHAGWAQLAESEFSDWVAHGVVGQIIPWNFPLLMLAWKIAPALATGNCVVLKPAQSTPLTALLFAELAAQAGLPAGVLNVVTGGDDTGVALVGHPGVDKIAFTGSTQAGREIRRQTAGTGKGLTLELGGKSPFIVFDNADLDAAVEGVVDAIWFNQGQVCCAGSRLLVQEDIADDFIQRLKRRMGTLRLGQPLDKTIDMGAIINASQLARITQLVEADRAQGANVWQAHEGVLPESGCFYPPTLVTDLGPGSALMQEEVFGPVLAAMTFRTRDEAVALANNTRYGLAASVWTQDIDLALDVAAELVSGLVWVNATNLFDAAAGFGGCRESGYGREGGREGLYEYLKPKAWLVLRGQTGMPDPAPAIPANTVASHGDSLPPLDRTAKLYVGGKQVRPDSGYAMPVHNAAGKWLGEVGEGNRKDIRNAVAAARKATPAWRAAGGPARAQVLYFLAENLSLRSAEFEQRLVQAGGVSAAGAVAQLQRAIARLFTYAAWADKFDGAIHMPPMRAAVLAMNEPLGVIGIGCPETDAMLSMISLLAPALAMGNCAVLVPGKIGALAACDLYQVLETSDIPAGVVNIVTGNPGSLLRTLAAHDDVDAVWSFGDAATATAVEETSAGNLKRTFTSYGQAIPWMDSRVAEGPLFLRQATQIKNIWVPYGD